VFSQKKVFFHKLKERKAANVLISFSQHGEKATMFQGSVPL
jgi:hypothetical protein